MPWLAGLLFRFLCTVPSTGSSTGTSEHWSQLPTVFVIISDLHITHVQTPAAKRYGDRAGDLEIVGKHLLRALDPTALLLTGDLVDAKDMKGKSKQYEEDWQMYQNMLSAVTRTSGLPLHRIIDIRGNHDVFDMEQRMGTHDYMPRYSASGKQYADARLHVIVTRTVQDSLGRDAKSHQQSRHVLERLDVNNMRPANPRQPVPCPNAVLLGLDITQAPGFKGPTNFVGLAQESLLVELGSALSDLRTVYNSCTVPMIAFGHHPLSTIAYPDGYGRNKGMDLDQLLATAGASVYLNGHLHALFGRYPRRMRPVDGGGYFLELEAPAWKDDRHIRILTVDGGTVSFADLQFLTPSRFPAAFQNYSGFAQISSREQDRDTGSTLVIITQPPDMRYTRLGYSGKAPSKYATVRALVVPLDLAGTGAPDLLQCNITLKWTCHSVPRNGEASMQWHGRFSMEDKQSRLYQASLESIRCAGSTLPELLVLQVVAKCEAGLQSTSNTRLALLHQGMLVDPDTPAPLRVSISEWFALAIDIEKFAKSVFWSVWIYHFLFLLLLPRALGAPLAADMHSNTLDASTRNNIVVDMPQRIPTGCTTADAVVTWSASPRSTPALSPPRPWIRFGYGTIPSTRDSVMQRPMVAACSATHTHPATLSLPVFNGAAAAGQTAPESSSQCSAVGRHMQVMRSFAQYKRTWLCLVLYDIYLALGPWMAASLLSACPPVLLYAYGMKYACPAVESGNVQQFHVRGGALTDTGQDDSASYSMGWRYVRSPDSFIVANLHMMLVVVPFTVWMAWVMAGWTEWKRHLVSSSSYGQMESTLPPLWPVLGIPLTPLQAIFGGSIMAVHTAMVWHLVALFGPLAFLVSPGFGWTGLLVTGVLLANARQLPTLLQGAVKGVRKHT